MTYSIEKPREMRLEDTALPNIFIEDILPDAEGDFVRVYLYAYMRCKQGTCLTHSQIAEALGIPLEKVLAAWRYFAEERKIVRKVRRSQTDETLYDIEFIDLKGEMYGSKKNGRTAAEHKAGGRSIIDEELKHLFERIAVIVGAPTLDGRDAEKILSWLQDDGATPEIVESAYMYGRAQSGVTTASYVGKIVKKWTGKGLRTKADAAEYLAENNARYGIYKSLMEALGLRYSVLTDAEQDKFDLWLDDYGYTPDRLLELAKNTAGIRNKLQYLGGIIKKEREKQGLGTDPGQKHTTQADREGHYRKLREKQEAEAEVRLAEVYAKIPKIKEIDDANVVLNMEYLSTLTSGKDGKKKAVESLLKRITGKQEERARLLEEAGYEPDYTDMKYVCERCKDTGLLENGASCDCFVKVR
ncbi:MAG: DnaD domain protein [Clostridiales Family XIII bacterium]|jgi:DnaD/phage-associated family protein|nr:DnaD domain protein [Clostridiales Family XIII bacterium]